MTATADPAPPDAGKARPADVGWQSAAGFVLAILLAAALAGIAQVVANNSSSLGGRMTGLLTVFVGFIQFVYVMPLFFNLRRRGQAVCARGLLWGAVLILFGNGLFLSLAWAVLPTE